MYLLPAGTNSAESVDQLYHASGARRHRPRQSANNTARDWGNRKRPTSRRASALPIRSRRSWWPAAGLVCSTTGLKIAGSPRTWERTIPFSSTSNYAAPNQGHPISAGTPFAGLRQPRGTRWNCDVRVGILLHSAYSNSVIATGLGLRGIQFDYTRRTR